MYQWTMFDQNNISRTQFVRCTLEDLYCFIELFTRLWAFLLLIIHVGFNTSLFLLLAFRPAVGEEYFQHNSKAPNWGASGEDLSYHVLTVHIGTAPQHYTPKENVRGRWEFFQKAHNSTTH